MNNIIKILIVAFLMQSCQEKIESISIEQVNWGQRTVDYELSDSLINGATYLSIYSQIYSETGGRMHDLTATISLRNTNKSDTVFIDNAEYYDTNGNLIRTYIKNTIFIAPMETIEIIIDEHDQAGGTGANFLFDWQIKHNTNEPLFEGIMISTAGQQGLSFTTQGKRVK